MHSAVFILLTSSEDAAELLEIASENRDLLAGHVTVFFFEAVAFRWYVCLPVSNVYEMVFNFLRFFPHFSSSGFMEFFYTMHIQSRCHTQNVQYSECIF